LEPQQKEKILEILRNAENFEESIKIIIEKAEELNINTTVIKLITNVFSILILRRQDKLIGKVLEAKQKVSLQMHQQIIENTPKPIKAIVRIRIPLIEEKPLDEGNEEEEEEEENEEKDEQFDNEEGDFIEENEGELLNSKYKKNQEKKFREAELEDKVLTIKTISENTRILVLHQAVSRQLRADIVNFLLTDFKEMMEGIDPEECQKRAEIIGLSAEDAFIQNYSELPVFDFEIN